MTYLTHELGGLITGSALVLSTEIVDKETAGIILAVSVAGALFPDIDHIRSKISRSSAASSAISHVVKLFTKHRGAFHTPLVLIVITSIFFMLISFLPKTILPYRLMVFAFFAGYLSHLVLDSLNPGGIMWFWPFQKKYFNIAKIKTDTFFEYIIMIPMLFIAAMVIRGTFV